MHIDLITSPIRIGTPLYPTTTMLSSAGGWGMVRHVVSRNNAALTVKFHLEETTQMHIHWHCPEMDGTVHASFHWQLVPNVSSAGSIISFPSTHSYLRKHQIMFSKKYDLYKNVNTHSYRTLKSLTLYLSMASWASTMLETGVDSAMKQRHIE